MMAKQSISLEDHILKTARQDLAALKKLIARRAKDEHTPDDEAAIQAHRSSLVVLTQFAFQDNSGAFEQVAASLAEVRQALSELETKHPQPKDINRRLSPDEFKSVFRVKGWTGKLLASRWNTSEAWVSKIANKTDRTEHWDDAVRGLPDLNPLPKVK
jgi:hypothetical protein